MTLASGTRLGPYEITGALGAGGMGDVYRARDTRLDRTVAIKIAKEEFSERFDREARAVAALNHPHICQLHDVGPNYLVMEYVDGAPLIGPLPVDQALTYASQVCAALDAAHRAGIVHRDLKPGNILITKNGVKLLDFGLAKVQQAVSGDAEAMTRALTGAGTILGTLNYMSPEQLQGREADARSDIFSFGLVLYEVITGKRAFEGSSPASVVAAIIERPAPTLDPAGVDRIVSACLAKNPDDRFQTARDLKRAIEWNLARVESPSAATTPAASKWWMAWAALAIAATGLAVAGWFRPTPAVDAAGEDITLTIVPPETTGLAELGSVLAQPLISPDGRSVAYRDVSGRAQLRRLDSTTPQPILTFAPQYTSAAWSPDSLSLAIDFAGSIRKARVPNGAPEVLAKSAGPSMGISFADNGAMLFSTVTTKTNLSLSPAAGGAAHPIELPGLGSGSYMWPQFIPGTDDFIVAFEPDGSPDVGIYRATLRDGRPADPVRLMTNATAAQYTPAGGGRLLFVRDATLLAQALAIDGRQLTGDPEVVANGVASAVGFRRGEFSVSRNGVVAWRPGQADSTQVTNFDRGGRRVGITGPPSSILSVKLSPDDRHVLVSSQFEQWIGEPNQPGKFTIGRQRGWLTTIWSPDSSRLLLPSPSLISERDVSAISPDQTATNEIAKVPGLNRLEDVSADGALVLFTSGALATRLLSVRLDGPPEARTPRTVIDTGELIFNARFSPDGRWIVFEAYQSMAQPGGIFVLPFSGAGLRRQIASTGQYPVWRKDGREIVYIDQGKIWSVGVNAAGKDLAFTAPTPLFAVGSPGGVRDVTPLAVTRDGQRFYVAQLIDQPDSDVIHVRKGWLKP